MQSATLNQKLDLLSDESFLEVSNFLDYRQNKTKSDTKEKATFEKMQRVALATIWQTLKDDAW